MNIASWSGRAPISQQLHLSKATVVTTNQPIDFGVHPSYITMGVISINLT
jgi:hypothetical protein